MMDWLLQTYNLDREFNEIVNMSAKELENWLKDESSQSSGWSKEDGSAETVGHERYVKGIMRSSETKPDKWSENHWDSEEKSKERSWEIWRRLVDWWSRHTSYLLTNVDDIAHMRKVVSYCKRHLAQEEKAKQDTNSKSYRSLKNWGHDAQKTWKIMLSKKICWRSIWLWLNRLSNSIVLELMFWMRVELMEE